jgi:20S proteasome alpha/beta subunit
MTLAMAITALDGLVLATDTRKTGRAGAVDDSDKLMPVNRDIGVLTYGLAEPGRAGMTQLIAEVERKRWAHFSLIAKEATRIFQESYDAWGGEQEPRPKHMPGGLGFILGGYDHLESSSFRIVHYVLEYSAEQPLGVFTSQPRGSQVLAGRWHVAQYFLRKMHYPEMTVREVAELSAFMLAETMVVEPTVGGTMELALVTREKGFENLHAEEVAEVLRAAQPRFAALTRIYRNVVLGLEAHLL